MATTIGMHAGLKVAWKFWESINESAELYEATRWFLDNYAGEALVEATTYGEGVTVTDEDFRRIAERAEASATRKEYVITVAENVRQYTEYRVTLTGAEADALRAREMEEVDGDADIMDMLGDMGIGNITSTLPHREPETTILGVEVC